MFLYIYIYEFIRSQNLHAMKGLLIGTFLLSRSLSGCSDESDNIYCYAEDYNANAQDEKAAMTMITLMFTLSINKNS